MKGIEDRPVNGWARANTESEAGGAKTASASASGNRAGRVPICIIVENNSVPFDRRVWKEARALADAGYRVSVICPKSPGAGAGHEIIEGVEIYRHPRWEAANALGYIGEYTWSLICEFLLALRVYIITRFRVMQACNPPDTIFLVAAFFKLLGVRFVFDHHDLSPELFETKFGRKGFVYRLLRATERLTFHTADACIATNESFKEIALTRGNLRPEQVFVVRNCPDLSEIANNRHPQVAKTGKRLRVVYVGLMAEQDGLDLLMQAIGHILKGGRQDTEFVLVGDGPVLPALREAVEKKGFTPFVTFTGRVPHEVVGGYLSASDVGVAPDPKNALNDHSTMIKVFEYMAYGLPVVMFDLKEGRRSADAAALYARPNDPIDLAAQITKLLDCKELRRQLGDRGRKRIEHRLNWQHEKVQLLEAYETATYPDSRGEEQARVQADAD
ncbi:MAG TPA: glycosyltransferase family 4 protein [Terriglobia bacterium]|nr:glycosyltransferase family 4 protein [Terriglobia bacterium]